MIHTHMTPENRKSTWPRSFGRTFTYLRPHCRPLLLGMLFAVGVSIFYTFSISSVVPLLKTMFADNESLPVWITRMEAEWRLGISTNADLPDDSEGFEATDVDDDSPCRDRIRAGDRIVAIGGERYGSYELLARIAHSEEASIPDVTIVSAEDGQSSSMNLALRPRAAWQDPLDALVARLPAGSDVNSRMWMLTIVMLAVVTASFLGSVCRFLNDSLVATAVQRAMHDLRTRLSGTQPFIQLHLELAGDMTLTDAHIVSDQVEAEIMAEFPDSEVIIHQDPEGLVEPPPKYARTEG